MSIQRDGCTTIVALGQGDVAISRSGDRFCSLALTANPLGFSPIGYTPPDDTPLLLGGENEAVVLEFSDVRSLDVLIEEAQALRTELTSGTVTILCVDAVDSDCAS